MNKRQILFSISIFLMLALALIFVYFGLFPRGTLLYVIWGILAVYFFGILVSNQQFEEDTLATTERITGSVLFSFIIILEIVYFPLAHYVFGSLVKNNFFLSDFLAFLFFLFFFGAFWVTATIVNRTARYSFFPSLTVFNNEKAYFALRLFFLPAVFLVVYLYILSPFLIITS